MKKKDKKLVFADLCARLPYGVRVKGTFPRMDWDTDKVKNDVYDKILDANDLEWLTYCGSAKPYLRHMSSMTESEYNEFQKAVKTDNGIHFGCGVQGKPKIFTLGVRALDWLNTHHFDYRGLIEMGLAIEASREMYNEE
jgi:hypothetical protein